MAAIAAWLAFAPRTAHAERTAFELAWSAPAECPSGKEIVDATRTRLAANGTEELPPLFVRGEVRPEHGGFLVALAMQDGAGKAAGKRQVHVAGPSCGAVAEATALVLAMIIAARPRDEAPSGGPPEEPAPPPFVPSAPESRPTPAPSLRKPQAPALPKRPSPRVLVGAGAVVSRGVLPIAGGGLALRAAYAPVPLVLVGIEASFEIGGAVRDATSEVNFQLIGGSAFAGVPVLRAPRLELILALTARAGAIRTYGKGFKETEEDMRAIALVGPGAVLRAKLASSWFIEAFPQAEVPLVRDRFQMRDGETMYPIHRPAPVAGRLSLGIAYEFP